MKVVVLVTVLVLGGCQTQMRMIENDGALSVEPTNDKGANYIVKMRNQVDFGFNPDDRASRHEWALRYTNVQCPSGRIVSESSIETGTYATGRKSRTHFVYVACS